MGYCESRGWKRILIITGVTLVLNESKSVDHIDAPDSILNETELIAAMGIITTATGIGPGGSKPHLWLVGPSIDLKALDLPAD